MEVAVTTDSQDFFDRHCSIWLENEASCGALMKATRAGMPESEYYSVVNSEGTVLLTACFVPNDQVLISNGERGPVEKLAHFLSQTKKVIPRLFAPSPVSTDFSSHYSKLEGCRSTCLKKLGHYELMVLSETPEAKGRFGLAGFEDREILVKYRRQSQSEGNIQRPVDARETIDEELDSSSIYVWKNSQDQIVCMGSLFEERSPRSAYINEIFTPSEYRKMGYATSLLLQLVKLSQGKVLIPSLAVDVNNQGAIRIYEKMGFERQCQMENIKFYQK